MTNMLTLMICAHGEDPYLEACVKSLANQTIKTELFICTSTPNDHIVSIANKYGVTLRVNPEKNTDGYGSFTFAFNEAKTKFVTLCHQDDVYMPEFAEYTLKCLLKAKEPIVSFTNYYEIKSDKVIESNSLLLAKRILNFPFTIPGLNNFKAVRRLILSLGCPICNPSLTYNKEKISYPFLPAKKVNVDWLTWIEFSRLKGSFVYISKPLMMHRIHEKSTTTEIISNGRRKNDDYEVFQMLWPKPIASLLSNLYSAHEKANKRQ